MKDNAGNKDKVDNHESHEAPENKEDFDHATETHDDNEGKEDFVSLLNPFKEEWTALTKTGSTSEEEMKEGKERAETKREEDESREMETFHRIEQMFCTLCDQLTGNHSLDGPTLKRSPKHVTFTDHMASDSMYQP